MLESRETDDIGIAEDRRIRNAAAAPRYGLYAQSTMPRRALTFSIAVAVLAFVWLYTYWSPQEPWLRRLGTVSVHWTARRDEVKAAFVHSWNAYEKHAWGEDAWGEDACGGGESLSPEVNTDSSCQGMIAFIPSHRAGLR